MKVNQSNKVEWQTKKIFKFPVAIIYNMKRDEKLNSDILKITMLVEEGFLESQLIIHHFKLDDFINA